MPDEIDAEVLEVFGGQLRQDNHINGVVAKRLLVLLQPKLGVAELPVQRNRTL